MHRNWVHKKQHSLNSRDRPHMITSLITLSITETLQVISWREHITNDELMKRSGTEDLSNIVGVRSLTLAGHILRLPPDRPASVDIQWEPDGGRSRRGRPRKTRRQTFQENLHEMRVSWSGVCRVASDQSRWKSVIAQCFSTSGRIEV